VSDGLTRKAGPGTGHPSRTSYRAMHYSAKRGIAVACRPSVCPSVCDVDGSGPRSLEILETKLSFFRCVKNVVQKQGRMYCGHATRARWASRQPADNAAANSRRTSWPPSWKYDRQSMCLLEEQSCQISSRSDL